MQLDPHSWKSTQRCGFICIVGLSFSTSDLKQVTLVIARVLWTTVLPNFH